MYNRICYNSLIFVYFLSKLHTSFFQSLYVVNRGGETQLQVTENNFLFVIPEIQRSNVVPIHFPCVRSTICGQAFK